MNGQHIIPSAGFSSNILDDHLSKVNSRLGFKGGFGKQLSFKPNPNLLFPDKDADLKVKENELKEDYFDQMLDQNTDDLSTKFATTYKSGCTGHSFVEKISCGEN